MLRKLRILEKDVLYSGDSGNDFLPLTCGFNGVLVKNASEEVKRELRQRIRKRKLDNVYIARGNFNGSNGNYVSGIIEGAYHFGFFH